MRRLALLAAGVTGLTALAVSPTGAATATTLTTCGPIGYQAGLATKVCADVTGNTVEFYGRVSLAGPPSPGSPAPTPKELTTTLSAAVVGGASLGTQAKQILFSTSTIEVHGVADTLPCDTTVRGTLGVASYPWTPNPVPHTVTVTC
ncbi:hypothetical protein [Streptomyces sp. NPDC006879]|uniref:hypothetical protein n=1 Tax=Streptomyces sp. NPDC006879 TaxID=3364767 RepID=UPI003693452F